MILYIFIFPLLFVRTVLWRCPGFQLLVILITFKVRDLTVWYLKSVAERSKARVCDRSLAGIAGSNTSRESMDVSCVSSRRGLSDEPITCLEESYWVCVLHCVWLDAKITFIYLKWVDRRRSTREIEKEETSKERVIFKIKFLSHISQSVFITSSLCYRIWGKLHLEVL
jgi:hypothetical protein